MNKQRVEKPKNPENEFWQSADILEKNFIQRRDVHALQLDDGRYICMHGAPTKNQIISHIKGEITLGTYILDENDNARFTVLDADNDVQYHMLFLLADKLDEEGIFSYIEASRRGGHLWFFYEEPIIGKKAKGFGDTLVHKHIPGDMEVFPKQERTKGGPGSLIRLPFGVHRKSGKRYPFVRRVDGLPIADTNHGQILKMRYPHKVGVEDVDRYIRSIPNAEKTHIESRSNDHEDNIWARIRTSEPAIDFIGRYVELTPTSKGAIGYCPFHDDEHRSFSVNRDGNYWNCFAGCGGGSIIDFYMKLKNVELGEAVHDLRKMLEVD